MSASAEDLVTTESREGVFSLRLNQPNKRNSLSAALVDEILANFARATEDGARLIILEGAGKSFSGGFDFSGLESQSDEELAYRFLRIETLLQTVAYSRVPTLALAQGPVFGAGADLFAACDQRVTDSNATFRFPGLKFEVVLGTRRLQRLVGTDAARAMLESSSTITAEQAHTLGLATQVCPRNDWPSLMEHAASRATVLTPVAAGVLSHALEPDTSDADLADLARSVLRPGLRERIQNYVREPR